MDRETKRVIRDTAIIFSLVVGFLFVIHGCESRGAVLSPRQAAVATTAGKPMVQAASLPNPLIPQAQVLAVTETNQPFVVNSNINTVFYGIGLAWDPSVSTNVAGYMIYFGAASRTYTNVTDVGLQTNVLVACPYGFVIYYAVTAYNTIGLESDYSSEVSYGHWLPDRVTVNWPTNQPATLLLSTSLSLPRSAWTVALPKSNAGTITVMLGPGSVYFCLQGSTNRLTIHAWNPLNQ
jgi:hypothetical protein